MSASWPRTDANSVGGHADQDSIDNTRSGRALRLRAFLDFTICIPNQSLSRHALLALKHDTLLSSEKPLSSDSQ